MDLKYGNPSLYDWSHAGKYCPSFFTLVFAGFDKDLNLIVDNYCNIIEQGDLKYDRGECTLYINDKKKIVNIYELN